MAGTEEYNSDPPIEGSRRLWHNIRRTEVHLEHALLASVSVTRGDGGMHQLQRFATDCTGETQPCEPSENPLQNANELAKQWLDQPTEIQVHGRVSTATSLATASRVLLRDLDVSSSLHIEAPDIAVVGAIAGDADVTLHASRTLTCGNTCTVTLVAGGSADTEGPVRPVLRLEGTEVVLNGTVAVADTGGELALQSSYMGCRDQRISILGDAVTVGESARVQAPSGTVLVGGGFGVDTLTRRANTTSIARGAELSVDSESSQTAGCVAVWADDLVSFRGSISARGGMAGGDGGFVEVRCPRMWCLY